MYISQWLFFHVNKHRYIESRNSGNWIRFTCRTTMTYYPWYYVLYSSKPIILWSSQERHSRTYFIEAYFHSSVRPLCATQSPDDNITFFYILIAFKFILWKKASTDIPFYQFYIHFTAYILEQSPSTHFAFKLRRSLNVLH